MGPARKKGSPTPESASPRTTWSAGELLPWILGNGRRWPHRQPADLGGTTADRRGLRSSCRPCPWQMAELHIGSLDLVITGGADTTNDIFMYICFSKTPALSHHRRRRPFPDCADGTLLGEVHRHAGAQAPWPMPSGPREIRHLRVPCWPGQVRHDRFAPSILSPAVPGQALRRGITARTRAVPNRRVGQWKRIQAPEHQDGDDKDRVRGSAHSLRGSGRKGIAARCRPWNSVEVEIGTPGSARRGRLFKAGDGVHHRVLPHRHQS